MNDERDTNELTGRITDQIAREAAEEAMPADAAARIKARALARVRSASPTGTRTIRADDGEWLPFDEGVDRKLLVSNPELGVETALYRLQPGAGFPPHAHTHFEECWVVEGDLMVGDYLVQAGEMHVAEPGSEHPPIVARTPALLLIHSQVYASPLDPA